MSEYHKKDLIEDDEITLKEFIIKIQEYGTYLWLRKNYIIGVGLFMAAVFLLQTYLKPTIYSANLTFMVNEDEGSSLGAAAAILGQFGFGGGNASEYNLDKIVSLAGSRRIIQAAIFEKENIKGERDYIINHLIEIYDWHSKWHNDTMLTNFLFEEGLSTEFSNRENKVLKIIYRQIVGDKEKDIDGLLDVGYNEVTGILKLSVYSASDELSIALVNSVYEKLSAFYISQSTEKQQITVNNLKFRADSVEQILKSSEYELARLQDNSQGFLLRKSQLTKDQLTRRVQVLTILFGEILKNLSTSEFLLKNATPFFQVVDMPISPISPMPKKYFKRSIVGVVIGVLISSVFWIGLKLYREIMEVHPSNE